MSHYFDHLLGFEAAVGQGTISYTIEICIWVYKVEKQNTSVTTSVAMCWQSQLWTKSPGDVTSVSWQWFTSIFQAVGSHVFVFVSGNTWPLWVFCIIDGETAFIEIWGWHYNMDCHMLLYCHALSHGLSHVDVMSGAVTCYCTVRHCHMDCHMLLYCDCHMAVTWTVTCYCTVRRCHMDCHMLLYCDCHMAVTWLSHGLSHVIVLSDAVTWTVTCCCTVTVT